MIRIIMVVMIALAMSGCGRFEQLFSHVKSATMGLNRTATVYSYSGAPIKSWTFDSQVEVSDGNYRFMVNNKAVNVTGGVLIVEEQ